MAKTKAEKSAAKKRSNQFTKLPSLTGKKIGKWEVGREEIRDGRRFYVCVCECGKSTTLPYSRLVKKESNNACKSCAQVERLCKHGHDTELYGRTKLGICRMCCKERQLKFTYGITLAEYEELFSFQKGKCAICEKDLLMFKVPTPVPKKEAGGRAEVDHKHISKKERNKMKTKIPDKNLVRGLLCGGRWAGCNHKLGRVDNAGWLRKALIYVESPPAQQMFKRKETGE